MTRIAVKPKDCLEMGNDIEADIEADLALVKELLGPYEREKTK